jgi:hypothetical protein
LYKQQGKLIVHRRSISWGQFFKMRVGANFACRRQLEHTHHCCVGANSPRRRKLAFKKLSSDVYEDFTDSICVFYIKGLSTYLCHLVIIFRPFWKECFHLLF